MATVHNSTPSTLLSFPKYDSLRKFESTKSTDETGSYAKPPLHHALQSARRRENSSIQLLHLQCSA